MLTFKARKLCELRLHPIELGFGLSRPQAGRPVLAEGEIARLAVERFQTLSAPFGTQVSLDGSEGVIRP